MACRFAVVALALLVCAAPAAAQWVWNGGTMSFSDSANWANNNAPQASSGPNTPCATNFGPTNPTDTIISTMPVGTFYIGNELRLSRNGGSLRLARDGTVVAFTANAANGGCDAAAANYNWTGGVIQQERNDFYCHKNWLNPNGVQPNPATDPLENLVPCASDPVVFPTTTTYHAFVNNNASMVVIGSISVEGIVYGPGSNLATPALENEVNLVNTKADVYVLTNANAYSTVCAAHYQRDVSTTKCLCYSTCLSRDYQALVDSRINQIRSGVLATQAAIDNGANVTTIRGSFMPSSLGVSSALLSGAINNNTQKNIMVTGLQNAIKAIPVNWVTNVQLTLVNGNAAVSATVNSSTSTFYLPGTSTFVTNYGTVSQPPVNVSIPQTVIQNTLNILLLAYQSAQLADQIAQQQQNNPSQVNDVINTLSGVGNSTNYLLAAANDPCFATCVTNCSLCVDSLITTLTNAGLNSTIATQLANQLTAAKDAAGGDPNFVDTVSSGVNTTQSYTNSQTQLQQNTLQTFSGSATLYTASGSSWSTVQQLYLVDPANYASTIATISNVLGNSKYLKGYGNVAAMYSTGTGSRRRAAAGSVAVTFNYNVSCTASDTACQGLSTIARTDILNQINTNIGGQKINYPLCYLPTRTEEDTRTCLSKQLSAFCMANPIVNIPLAQQWAYNNSICGVFPHLPSGACYDSPYSVSQTNITAYYIAMNSSCYATAEASSAGGGGLGMAAGAAGAGVAIIAVIIVVVVLRRRKAKQENKGGVDRTVVAFENPMYDDPTANPAHEGAYAHRNDSEGLYDEPAFNQASKHNPVYSSRDGLDINDPGYLETGAKGDGYLDVNPNAAEDVGYLDQPGASSGPGYLDHNEIEPAYMDRKGIRQRGEDEPQYQETAGYQDSNAFGFGAAEPEAAPAVDFSGRTYDQAITHANTENVYSDGDAPPMTEDGDIPYPEEVIYQTAGGDEEYAAAE